MNQALFINGETQKIINAEEIQTRTDYLEKYAGHLFCPTPNCRAQLTFALTPTFRIKQMFKTGKNSEHIDNCPHKVVHNGTNRHYYTSEVINQALSSKHKRDVLKQLYRRNQEQEENANATPAFSSKPTKKVDTENSNAEATPRSVASISPDAEPVKAGQKEPPVRKRKSNDILPENENQLLGIDGYALSANITDNYIEIYIDKNLSLLFYNAFRDSSPEAYQHVHKIACEIIEKHEPVLVCCIGVVEKKGSSYQVQIMDSSLITFNDKSALSFYL